MTGSLLLVAAGIPTLPARPSGQKYHYEILSGTESNFELHGRRMASTFFRMIFF